MNGEIPFNPLTPPEKPEIPEDTEAEIPGKGPYYLAGEINYYNDSGNGNKLIKLRVRQATPAIQTTAKETGYIESVTISNDEFAEIFGDNDTTAKLVQIGDIFFFSSNGGVVDPNERYNIDRHFLMTRRAWLNKNPS